MAPPAGPGRAGPRGLQPSLRGSGRGCGVLFRGLRSPPWGSRGLGSVPVPPPPGVLSGALCPLEAGSGSGDVGIKRGVPQGVVVFRVGSRQNGVCALQNKLGFTCKAPLSQHLLHKWVLGGGCRDPNGFALILHPVSPPALVPESPLGPQPPCSTYCPSSAPDAQGRGEQASGGQTEQKASSTPQGMATEGSHHSPDTKTLKILYRCQDVVPRFVCQLQTEPSECLSSFFNIPDKTAEGCSPNSTSMGSAAPPHQP